MNADNPTGISRSVARRTRRDFLALDGHDLVQDVTHLDFHVDPASRI